MARLLAVASVLIALWANCREASAMSIAGRGFGGDHGDAGAVGRPAMVRRPAVMRRPMAVRRPTAARTMGGQFRIRRIGHHAGRTAGTRGDRGPHRPPRRPGPHRPPIIVKLPSLVPPAITSSPAGPASTASAPPAPRSPRLATPAGFPRLIVPGAGEQRYVRDEVLVSFSANVDSQTVVGIAQAQRLAVRGIHRLPLVDTILYRFRITDGRSVAEVIASFSGDNRISQAQPNYLYAAQNEVATPSNGDPAQYALGKLDVPQAHLIAQGERILVALIDTSVDLSHPDLHGVVAGRFDAVKGADQPDRHGTAMAGAIAAHGRLMGIAPAARLLVARAFETTPSGARGTTTRLLDCLQWASDSGARVINMSFGGPADPRLRDMIIAVRRKGAALIAAAGNDGPTAPPVYPAAYPEVIAVTATDIQDHVFARANRGAYVGLAAPGVDVLVDAPNGGYSFTTGTSVAAAQVSGIAALLISHYPGLAPETLSGILLRTAKDLGPTGRDNEFGAGLANASAALDALSAQVSEQAAGN